MVMRGGCVQDGWRCRCACHKPGRRVKHVMACCITCGKCGKRIRRGAQSHPCKGLSTRVDEPSEFDADDPRATL